AWAKDAAGNVSAGVSDQVVITLPDVTKPTVTAFNLPATSLSLVVPISSFIATDNNSVTGYMITESAAAPDATDAGWSASTPSSFTFFTEGSKTLYAWAKDEAGNVSTSVSNHVLITSSNAIKPTIASFAVPATSSSLVVPINRFIVTDNLSVTGYLITESTTIPQVMDLRWSATPPNSYTFSTEGTKTLYAWIKDAAGNVSDPYSSKVVIALSDTVNPIITSFSIPSISASRAISIISFTATDNDKVTGYQLTETATPPFAGESAWNTYAAPASYVFSTSGIKTLYAWVKDAAGNISDPVSRTVKVILPALTVVENIIICEGDLYEGWSTTGRYERILTAISGADSIVTTNLTVTPVYYVSEEISILEGENYKGWTETGQYEKILHSVNGCDSIVITNLTVNPLQKHFISLKDGWNIGSSYLLPVDQDVSTVFENLMMNNQLVEVQDENGISYLESDSGWINDIGQYKGSEGYKIKVNTSCVMEINGFPIPLPYSISLHKGWNIISFPHHGAIDAMQIIQPLIDDGILEKIQDEKGNSIENWGDPFGWINGIGNFTEGEGYLVQVNDDCDLPVYKNYEKSAVLLTQEEEPNYFQVAYEGNGFAHMNINITGLIESDLHAGDEIAVFDGGICVGAIKLNDININSNIVSIQASASDQDAVNGFTTGDPIEIRFWDEQKMNDVLCQIEPVKGELFYQKQGSVFVALRGEKKIAEKELTLNEIEIYPNPATDVITIRFPTLPKTGTILMLTDIAGKLLFRNEASSSNVKVNLSNQPPGIYFIKIISEEDHIIKKFVLR
ncbi:MAG: T9SS type A sorting domain-containing protein, partial [Prolixibacteraceae bacterium]|nr:T9SS type A sorting domain-containing protein [Prolixibacteraceae bacterium]